MALGTVISKITGVLRDVAAAAALGFYIVADAFSLGNSLPTIVYILLIGGALNAVFVPQLVRRMKEDPDGGTGYADRLITAGDAGVDRDGSPRDEECRVFGERLVPSGDLE